MKLKMAGSGSVDVADSAFGAEFNQPLVQNHGVRKVRVVHVLAPFAARSGLAVVAHLLQDLAITRRRSTRKCIAAPCAPFSQSWCDRIDW